MIKVIKNIHLFYFHREPFYLLPFNTPPSRLPPIISQGPCPKIKNPPPSTMAARKPNKIFNPKSIPIGRRRTPRGGSGRGCRRLSGSDPSGCRETATTASQPQRPNTPWKSPGFGGEFEPSRVSRRHRRRRLRGSAGSSSLRTASRLCSSGSRILLAGMPPKKFSQQYDS